MEGSIAVTELLRSGVVASELFVSVAPASDVSAIVALAVEKGVPTFRVSDAVAKSLSSTTTPQGVVAVARYPAPAPLDFSDTDLVLLLAEVRDPGNAGTLIRSAVAAGAGAVVFSERCVDPFGPKTVRAASGCLFRTQVERDATLGTAASALRSQGFTLVGSDAAAARAHTDIDLTRRVAVVLGNEAWGLSEDARELLDEVVSIPMPGPAESLNVAIAGSVLLFEAVRQRRAGLSSTPS